MKKLISIFLWLVGFGFAQGTQTIYEKAFSSKVTPGTYDVVNNIGQANHQINISLVDLGGCTTVSNINVRILGSYDGLLFTPIGYPFIGTLAITGTAVVNTSGSAFGFGAYPRIRIQKFNTNSDTNCGVDVWYTGTLQGGNNQLGTAIEQNIATYNVSGSSANTDVVTPPSDSITKAVVYGLRVYNPSAAKDINIGCWSGSILTNKIVIDSMQQYSMLLLGVSTRPYLVCPIGYTLRITDSAVTNLDISVQYRLE